MFLKKAKEAAKEDEAKRKIERARKAREEAKLEAMKPTQPARPVETEAQAALRKAEERKRKGPTEAQLALQKAEERKRQQQEQADLNEALRRSKVDQGGFAARPQLGGGGPGGPVGGKPRIIQTAAPKADMRIASFHEPDEFDQHWRDQKVACSYVGTFAIDVGKIDKGKILTGMRSMLQYIAQARPATLFFSREGIKVIDTTANKVAMAHALQRISMATGDAQSTLFAFVAKNPKVVDRYCHVFNMPATRTAEDCQALVMKAFRLAFASRKTSQRAKKGQPNAALAAARAAVAGKASAPAPPAMQQHAPDPTRPNKQWAKHNPLQGVHLGRGQAGQAPPSAQPRMSAQIAPKRTSAGGGGGGGGAGGGGGNPQRVPAVGSADDAPGLGSSGWYQPGIPREIAMELLGASAEGSFIVRDSSSQPGQFALTMFAGGLMHHYIIRKVAEGVVLGSEDQGQKPLPDLPSLIIDYSRAKGCLPVVLNLDTVQPPDEEVNSSDDEDDDDDNLSFVDPDYQSMKDLR
eukprot:gene3710-18849_t